MTLANVIRGAGIALVVATGLSLAGCGSCNTPQPQPAAPEQPQQFESAKDRVSCKSKKRHHKKAKEAAAEQQEQSTEQSSSTEQQ